MQFLLSEPCESRLHERCPKGQEIPPHKNPEMDSAANDAVPVEVCFWKAYMRLFQSLCKLIIADIRYVNSSVAGQSF